MSGSNFNSSRRQKQAKQRGNSGNGGNGGNGGGDKTYQRRKLLVQRQRELSVPVRSFATTGVERDMESARGACRVLLAIERELATGVTPTEPSQDWNDVLVVLQARKRIERERAGLEPDGKPLRPWAEMYEEMVKEIPDSGPSVAEIDKRIAELCSEDTDENDPNAPVDFIVHLRRWRRKVLDDLREFAEKGDTEKMFDAAEHLLDVEQRIRDLSDDLVDGGDPS